MYGWAMSQNLHVNDFNCTEDVSKFDESFIKSYNEESDEVDSWSWYSIPWKFT